jgi:outer membrane protein assembly factor BamA
MTKFCELGRACTALFILLCCAVPSLTMAQEASQTTRQDELRELRTSKATGPTQGSPSRIERGLLWLQERKIQEKLETPGAGYKGFRPRLGGLTTGSGFGFGIQYDRTKMLDGQLDMSFSGAVSTKLYQLYYVQFDLPRLAGNHLFASAMTRYRNGRAINFYGLGSDSVVADRTTYLYEDLSYGFSGGVRPNDWFRLGSEISWLDVNVGRGKDSRLPTTQDLFDEASAPGLEKQPAFLRAAFFAEVDYRDEPSNPHSGGFYRLQFSSFDDRELNRFDFNRLEAEIQQYIPFNHGHRVIAARAAASFDRPEDNNQVPFYFQRTLGGSNDLRGFREFRFRDRNQLVFNLEYRWESWIGLDMALFADAGKVFGYRSDLNLKNLETAYGIGFRFNTTKNVFFRIDIGHGSEGTRFFMKFGPVFQGLP